MMRDPWSNEQQMFVRSPINCDSISGPWKRWDASLSIWWGCAALAMGVITALIWSVT